MPTSMMPEHRCFMNRFIHIRADKGHINLKSQNLVVVTSMMPEHGGSVTGSPSVHSAF